MTLPTVPEGSQPSDATTPPVKGEVIDQPDGDPLPSDAEELSDGQSGDESSQPKGKGVDSNGDTPSAPMQKRRRVTRACDECRRKKIKYVGYFRVATQFASGMRRGEVLGRALRWNSLGLDARMANMWVLTDAMASSRVHTVRSTAMVTASPSMPGALSVGC